MSSTTLITQANRQQFDVFHGLKDDLKKKYDVQRALDSSGNLAYSVPHVNVSLIGANGSGDDDDDDDDDDADPYDDDAGGVDYMETGVSAATLLSTTTSPAVPSSLGYTPSSLSAATAATTATTAVMSSSSSAAAPAPVPAGLVTNDDNDDDDDDDSATDDTRDYDPELDAPLELEQPPMLPPVPTLTAAAAAAAAATTTPAATPKRARKPAAKPSAKPAAKPPPPAPVFEDVDEIDEVVIVPEKLEHIRYTGLRTAGDVFDGVPVSVILQILTRATPFSHRRFTMVKRVQQTMTRYALSKFATDASPDDSFENSINLMLLTARYRSLAMSILEERSANNISFANFSNSPSSAPAVVGFYAAASGMSTPPFASDKADIVPSLFVTASDVHRLYAIGGTWSASARSTSAFGRHPLMMATTGYVAALLNDLRTRITIKKIKKFAANSPTAQAALQIVALASVAERLQDSKKDSRVLALDDEFEVASGQRYSSLPYAQAGSYRDVIGFFALSALDDAIRISRLVSERAQLIQPNAVDTAEKLQRQAKTVAVAETLLGAYTAAFASRAAGRVGTVQRLAYAETQLERKHRGRIAVMLRCYILMKYSNNQSIFVRDGATLWLQYYSQLKAPPMPSAEEGSQKRQRTSPLDEYDEDDDDDDYDDDDADDDDDESLSSIQSERIGADPNKRGTKRTAHDPDVNIEGRKVDDTSDLMSGQPLSNIFALMRTTTQTSGFLVVTNSEAVRGMIANYKIITDNAVVGNIRSAGAIHTVIGMIRKAVTAMHRTPEDSFSMQAFLAGFGLRLAQLLENVESPDAVLGDAFANIWDPTQAGATQIYALICVAKALTPQHKLTHHVQLAFNSVSTLFDMAVQAPGYYVKWRTDINADRLTDVGQRFADAVSAATTRAGTLDMAILAKEVAEATQDAINANEEIEATLKSLAETGTQVPPPERALQVLGTQASLSNSVSVGAILAGHYIIPRVFTAGLNPSIRSAPSPIPHEIFHLYLQLYVFAVRFAFDDSFMSKQYIIVDVAIDPSEKKILMSKSDPNERLAPGTSMQSTAELTTSKRFYVRRFKAAVAMVIAAAIRNKDNTMLGLMRIIEAAAQRIDNSTSQPDEARALAFRTLSLLKFVVEVGTFIGDTSVADIQMPAATLTTTQIYTALKPVVDAFLAGRFNRIRAFVAGAIMSWLDASVDAITNDVYNAVVWHTTHL